MKTNNRMLFFLLIFPFLEPLLFKEYFRIDLIFSVYKVFSFFIILFLYIEMNNFSKLDIAIFFNEIILLVITLYNNGDIIKMAGPMISRLSFVMLTEVAIRKINIDFIEITYKICCIYMYINFITVIFFPDGVIKPDNWTPVYFLGIDNRFIFTLFPLIVFSLIVSLVKYNKITFYVYFIIFLVLIMFLYLWSIGAALGIILLIFYLIFIYPTKLNKKINYNILIVTIIILNLLTVYFQIQNYFSYFIVEILKKDITLSGRTILWNQIMEIIKNNFIFGIGIISNMELHKIFNVPLTHPHNLFLNIIYQGGVVSLIIYLYILKLIGIKLNECRYLNIKLYGILSISIFIILFLSIVDTIDEGIIYMIYVIGYNIKKIIKRGE